MQHRFSASLITLSLLLSLCAVPSSALTQIPTEPRVGDRCEKDPKVPPAWKKYQDFTWNYPACPHPYRYVSGKLTSKTPKTAQSDRSELLGAEQCMIANYWGSQRAKQARGEILGIKREDKDKKKQAWRQNFEFFGAPVAMFLFVHKHLKSYAALDAGIFLQTIMLSAHSLGLGTCAQGALATWASPVRNHLEIPKDYKLIVGLSLGYPSDNPINTFNVGRDDLDLGF